MRPHAARAATRNTAFATKSDLATPWRCAKSLLDSSGARAQERSRILTAVPPTAFRFLVLLALLVAACGGGGSGSGGGGGGGDEVSASLLIRWREVSAAAGYVIHWGTESGAYMHALDVGAPEPDAEGVVSFLLEDVGATGRIYFALTSYDVDFQMSAFSNELAAEVP